MNLSWSDVEINFNKTYWNSIQILQEAYVEGKIEKKMSERHQHKGKEEFTMNCYILNKAK